MTSAYSSFTFFYLLLSSWKKISLKLHFHLRQAEPLTLITLGLLDISAWLTFVTIMLLLTSEIAAHYGPSRGLLVDKRRLRIMAATTGMLILGLIALRVLQVLSY